MAETTIPIGSTGEDYYISTTKAREAAAALEGSRNKGRVSHDEFLKLLTMQLTNQDPLNPIDDSQFMGQMAQLQALDEQIQMTKTMVGMRLDSQLRAGNEMLEQVISGTDKNGTEHTGMVTSVLVSDDDVLLVLDNLARIPFENVTSVRAASLDELLG